MERTEEEVLLSLVEPVLLPTIRKIIADRDELKLQIECKSGTENCDLLLSHGFPCYRHLYEAQLAVCESAKQPHY